MHLVLGALSKDFLKYRQFSIPIEIHTWIVLGAAKNDIWATTSIIKASSAFSLQPPIENNLIT
jgi:hypothetical protein